MGVLVLATVLSPARSSSIQSLAGDGAANESGFRTVVAIDTTADTVDVNPGDGICADASGNCSLRASIQEANAGIGLDAVQLPPGTYTLTRAGGAEDVAATGDLDITDDLQIVGIGSGTTVVNGNGLDHVFHINSPGRVTFRSFMIRNGSTAGDGGGILVSGSSDLELREMAIVDCTAGGRGGGLRASNGTTTLTNVTLSNNLADRGGGVAGVGGAVSLTNVTIAHNSAATGGGGIDQGGSGFSVGNSIVALNTGGDCAIPFGLLGYNMDGDGSCGFVGPNAATVNPQLGPLQNNGGPSWTHALQPGSPAIDTGGNASCPVIDQRNSIRPIDGDGNSSVICDLGALEQSTNATVPADPSITKTDGVTTYSPGGSVTYTIVATNTGPLDATDVRIIDAVEALPQYRGATWSCFPEFGATCTLGPVAGDIDDVIDLPSGGKATYTLQLDIDGAATGDLVNTARLVPPSWVSDLNTSNNTAIDTDTQGPPTADLSIIKDDGLISVRAGTGLTYTILVTNNGPAAVADAVVTDVFDPAKFDQPDVKWARRRRHGTDSRRRCCPPRRIGSGEQHRHRGRPGRRDRSRWEQQQRFGCRQHLGSHGRCRDLQDRRRDQRHSRYRFELHDHRDQQRPVADHRDADHRHL